MVSTVLFAGPVWAQGAPQTVIERVDVQKLAAGYRSSKIVGSPVVNDANEKIGDVDDLLVEPSDKVLFAVLSVGGFLGMGEHLVVVPFSRLQITGNRVLLPGGTKDALKALPEFKYATK
jgi:PRC-barrel domain